MQYSWLNKNYNNSLIVFFNGWGMNETPVKHLKCQDFDVLMIYDYRDIDFDFSIFDFKKYNNKYLIAWSMGVYAVNLFSSVFSSFDKKIAINGTSKVIDDNFGIPKKIYNITIKFLSETSIDKFIKNMFRDGELNPEIKITKSTDELKEELIKIQSFNICDKINFTKAIVSDDDKIIPTKNQLNFWNGEKTNIEVISSTHCPFKNYSYWQELC